jgi:hypothetical protein
MDLGMQVVEHSNVACGVGRVQGAYQTAANETGSACNQY